METKEDYENKIYQFFIIMNSEKLAKIYIGLCESNYSYNEFLLNHISTKLKGYINNELWNENLNLNKRYYNKIIVKLGTSSYIKKIIKYLKENKKENI
jgi:hypothetical protein